MTLDCQVMPFYEWCQYKKDKNIRQWIIIHTHKNHTKLQGPHTHAVATGNHCQLYVAVKSALPWQ